MPAGSNRPRVPLTRERVMEGAMAVADAGGLEALTIRSLARELGVKPMAVYHHVAGKAEILDGIVDLVFGEIQTPPPGTPWRRAMRLRARSAREVLGRHPWAVALMDSRATPGPHPLRHHDSRLGTLRAAGFPVALAGHAVALLDGHVYGFVIQEAALPFSTPDETTQVAEQIIDQMAGAFPHLAELARERVLEPGYDFGAEFDFGLELILDGLERAAEAEPTSG